MSELLDKQVFVQNENFKIKIPAPIDASASPQKVHDKNKEKMMIT